jgi:hypothetical protein
MKSKMRLLAATLVTALAPVAFAQTAEVPPPATNAGQTLVATKIASNFVTLAGSQENALALVNALRNGTDVTLTTVVPPPEGSTEPPTTTTTTFTPPTGKMGWGNVKHSLALAQDALARAGIANPTAEQLQTALTGGDIVVTNADGTTTTTTLRGILTMRAEGMGWGNIAKAGGTKLGPVTSKVKMGNTTTTTTTSSGSVTTAAGGASPLSAKSKGITTAAGASVGAGPSKGITTASGATSSHGGGKGIVTAEGATAGHTPKGNAYGRGIVSASGGSTAGITTASGNGNGNNAGGNGKGNGKGGGKPGG